MSTVMVSNENSLEYGGDSLIEIQQKRFQYLERVLQKEIKIILIKTIDIHNSEQRYPEIIGQHNLFFGSD